MVVSRRSMLMLSAGASAATAAGVSVSAALAFQDDWESFRDLFDLSGTKIDMSAMLIAAHPRPVREAIERHRQAMDSEPIEYLEENGDRLTEASREAAARRWSVPASHVALTDSTTMGVGLVYTGLKVREGQELLTTEQDYYVTHESLRYLAERTGARVRRIAPFDRVAEATTDGMVQRIVEAIRPETRLLALTWVHSNTGVKMPVAAIATQLREVNAGRDADDQVLFGLDAVHGFGIEPDHFAGLGVDFLMSGCHKWLFGPRGTGIVVFSERGLEAVRPILPTFDDSAVFSAWYTKQEDRPANNGRQMTPGGFKAFEHRWAMAEAFALQEQIGVERIAARTHELASALKERLAAVPGVTLVTPSSPSLSSGITAFSVDGQSSEEVVAKLRRSGVIASVAPYRSALVRLTPSIRNRMDEVEAAVEALRASA